MHELPLCLVDAVRTLDFVDVDAPVFVANHVDFGFHAALASQDDVLLDDVIVILDALVQFLDVEVVFVRGLPSLSY